MKNYYFYRRYYRDPNWHCVCGCLNKRVHQAKFAFLDGNIKKKENSSKIKLSPKVNYEVLKKIKYVFPKNKEEKDNKN